MTAATVSEAISAELAQVQDPTEVIMFAGRPFKVAEKFGLMPLVRFAYLSKKGLDTGDMESLAAMYDVMRQAIADDDWEAFCDHAANVHADGDELIEVVGEAIQVISSRPTRRPSDSSDGPSPTETSSSAGSSSPGSSELTPRQAQLREQIKELRPVEEIAASLTLVPGVA